MKVYYLDSSVLVALLFQEPEGKKLLPLLREADEVLSANLLEAEVVSAGYRNGLTLKEILPFLQSVSLYFPDKSLLSELRAILEIAPLRGADAYHLAAALQLDPNKSSLTFLTLDRKQGDAAKKLGFKTV